jgi:hypothetical protein
MKRAMCGVAMVLGLGAARAQAPLQQEDFLTARERIEWEAGGLYEGRFDDGAVFQIELAYPRPAGVSQRDGEFFQSVWNPRHYDGQPTRLSMDEAARAGAPMRLKVLDEQDAARGAVYTVTLAADRASGRGVSSAPDGSQRAFTLRRNLSYTGIVVKRPAPPELADHGDYREHGFVFSTFFPVLGDPDADAWIRERAGICRDIGECQDQVHVRWRSPSLVSLDALAWGDSGGAHGLGRSVTRQYRIEGGRMTALGLDDFVDPGPACRAALSAAIVGKLKAKGMSAADQVDARNPGKFTPTPEGIAFHFDSYEAGSYAQGAPTVFVPRAQMGGCVKYLPAE